MWAATAQNLSCTKGHFSWGPSHSRPPKNPKNPTHFLGQHKGQNGFTSEASNLSQETCISKIHLMKVYGVLIVFVGGALGGKMLKCFKVFLERKRGPTTNGCYVPCTWDTPRQQIANLESWTSASFWCAHKWGTLFFFAKISENAWRFLNFANNAIQDNHFKFCKPRRGFDARHASQTSGGKKTAVSSQPRISPPRLETFGPPTTKSQVQVLRFVCFLLKV